MMTCQGCREQLLEYVYGLLDSSNPAEAGMLAELRTHLDACASCQAAYEQAKKQQQLLGEASRAKTNLTFTAPKMEPHRSRFVRQRATYVAWYVTAACLVFALLIGSGTAYWWGKSTRWNNVETAQVQLIQLRTSTESQRDQAQQLEMQISTEAETIQKLTKAVKKVEEEAQLKLSSSTSFQQILAPRFVEANNDAPIVVTNITLAGHPVPLPEVESNLRDSISQKALSNLNRRNDSASNKLSFDLPSVAYSNSANTSLVNEIVQDTSSKQALAKVIHPLQVLPARYTAHLCTDKPIYQPGEEVFFRGLALEKSTFQAPQEPLHYTFKLIGPDDKVIKQWSKVAQLVDPRTQQPLKDVRGQVIQAIGGDSCQLPANMPLGECQLTLTEKNDRFDAQTVKFMVNNITPPRFDKQLQFNRASYTPGDEVVVSGKIKLPSQQPWVHGAIKGQIIIDDNQYDVQGQKTKADILSSTDASGNVKLAFRLPASVEAGQGTLSLQFAGSDGIETWSHPLRIETGMLQIDCYPEGGDLIADALNTVYFQMRNKYGEAVEGEADLIDSKKQVVQKLSTFHDETEAKASRGMGVFQFTPKANEHYHLRLRKPASAQLYPLPTAKASGVGMHIEQPVLPAGSPLPITLSNVGQARQLAVSVHCRGVLIALDQLNMAPGTMQTIQVHPNKPLGGVYRVTASEIVTQNGQAQLLPQAERLIYRHPDKALKLNLKTEPMVGKTVRLQVDAKTEANQPSPAYVTIVGVNKSLLQMAEATTTRRLPAHFLIAQEVRQPEDLEFADFFLSRHASAPQALDLLLGVQGWRRFKETDDVAALKQLGQNLVDKLPVYCYDNRLETVKRVEEQVKELTEQSSEGKQLAQARSKWSALQTQWQTQSKKQTEAVESQQRELATAEKQYQTNLEQWHQFSLWFHLISACMLGLISLVGLVAIAWRRAILPAHLVWTVGALSVFGIVGAGLLWYWQPGEKQPVFRANPAERLDRSTEAKTERARPDNETAEGAAAGGVASSQPAPAKTEMPGKAPGAVAPLAAKGDAYRADASGKREEKAKPGGSNKDSLIHGTVTKKSDERPTSAPPAAVMPPSKGSGVRSNNVIQNEKEYNSVKNNVKEQSPQRQSYELQRVTKLVDNRAALPRDSAVPPGAKPKHAEAIPDAGTGKEGAKNPPPASLGARGGSGGIGGKSKMELTSPSQSGNTLNINPESRKKESGSTNLHEAVKNSEAFFVRTYSWREEERPEAMSPRPGTWSKTIYWHPMQVIPVSGKLEIPIELPSADGAYHFEVFGHDGEGRLGAGSIEVKSSITPVSLQLKLSKKEARVGELVRLECQVQNQSSRRQPQVMAKIQLPEGVNLSSNFSQLRNAVKTAKSYEMLEPTKWYVQDRELTLIWADLGSGQQVKLNIELNCSKPGTFTAAPSRAYLENLDQDAMLVPGLSITIKP